MSLEAPAGQIQSQTPTIKPISIDLPDTEIATLKELLRSKRYTYYCNERIRKKLGGSCCLCGGLAERIASYDCVGITRIERYCDPCVEKTFSRTPKVATNGGN